MNKGDPVVVRMVSNDIFPWQTACEFYATYQSGPAGPGDVFNLVADGNIELKLNGCSEEFVAMYSPVEET